MTVYSPNGNKPVEEANVADTANQFLRGMKAQQASGMDGKDVALGAISALRMFVWHNVGTEGIQMELADLADILVAGAK